MAKVEDIRKAFQSMAKTVGPDVSNIARVKDVNESAATCTLLDDDGLEYYNVRLRPVVNDNKSILIVPKIGSFVLAVRIEDQDEWMVVGYDRIEKIGYYIDGVVFEMDSEGFLLRNQNESLKALMADLLTAIEQMSFIVTTPDTISGTTTQMTNLVSFNQIKTRFNQFLK